MTQHPTLTQLSWSNYHQSVRRIAAKFNRDVPNYGLHTHDFMEIAVIAAGTCLHHSVLGDSRPRRGDVFVFRPGAWHGYAEVRKLSLYNCCFDTTLLGRELSWTADNPYLGRLLWAIPLSPKQHGMVSLHLASREFTRCRKFLDRLCSLAKEDCFSYYGDQLGLLIQILSLLARNLVVDSRTKPVKLHPAVASAIQLIDNAPTESWTLKRIASCAHIEPTYFVHLFHAVLGVTPMAYVTRRRLEIAASLLRSEGLPVGEVGAKSGWLDANYFSRCFRQHFGMTPSKYRLRFLAGGKHA